MFNVTIINVKGSLKKMILLIISLFLIFILTKFIKKFKTEELFTINISDKLIKCLDVEIPSISTIYQNSNTTLKNEEENINFLLEDILGVELAKVQEKSQTENNIANNDENVSKDKENTTNAENQEIVEQSENQTDSQENQNISVENILETAETTEVTQNPITETFNTEINGVKIKNETSFTINQEIMNTELDINKNNILIFHTHTCESYTPSDKFPYQQTGNFRTTDLNYTVSRVGDELTNYLLGFGFNVYHDKTYHDYPAYSGSYDRSLKTVENVLKTNPSDIIIDLHRDAIGSKSNYDPSVQIGEDVSAKMMFVIGTNGGGLNHPNWKENLKFAIEVQQKANEMYPGLFKPIIVRNSRYNQHLGKSACIIEVGATGNTLEQCLNSMKYLSKIFEQVLKK